jgi:hypothetical protein
VSALQHAADQLPPNSRVVIFTDSNNTIAMFSTLHCQPLYNPLVRYAADILMNSRLHLRVLHIPGELNRIANFLSRGQLMDVLNDNLDLTVHPFEPPPLRLGLSGC